MSELVFMATRQGRLHTPCLTLILYPTLAPHVAGLFPFRRPVAALTLPSSLQTIRIYL
jgi:hypothetical protein